MPRDYTAIVEKRKLTIQKKKRTKIIKVNENKASTAISKMKQLVTQTKDTFGLMYMGKITGMNKIPFVKMMSLFFAKYDKINVKQLSGRYKGQREIIEIIAYKKSEMSLADDIIPLINKVSKLLYSEQVRGSLDISIRAEKWVFGGSTVIGKKFRMNQDYDELFGGEYNAFSLFVSAFPDAKMGNSIDNNDCFYQCLSKVLFSSNPWSSDVELKRYLKIPINSKVPISYIPLIEKKLSNTSINVTGDHTYTSANPKQKVINLRLLNEHVTLNQNKTDVFRLRRKIDFFQGEKYILLYDKNTYECYDGSTVRYLSKEERNDIYDFKTKFILVNRCDSKRKTIDGVKKRLTFDEEYKWFISTALKLKIESKGQINLFRTGNFKLTALNLFDKFTKHIKHPPKIDQCEGDMIKSASQGAIVFGNSYNGPAHKADVKSMYPSILRSKMLFPIDEGELLYIKELPTDFFKYGIYRCEIKYDSTKTKVFKFNEQCHYTHIDLSRAKELALDIQLIVDDKPNFLFYSRDKLLTGSELFGEYVNYMFDLKEKKISGAKEILNILYGGLSQRIEKHTTYKYTDNFEIAENNHFVLRKSNISDDQFFVTTICRSNQYVTGYARILPFILAKGRSLISKIIEPIIDDVYRCHTDGIEFTRLDAKATKFGNEIGDLVYEGYCSDCVVINCKVPTGDFIL